MTNEEAIEGLERLYGKIEQIIYAEKRQLEAFDSIDTAISALEENTKLKAENEQLKAELEQSIKLPCSQWNLCVDKMPSVITGNYIVCLENEAIMMANYSAFSNKFKEISTMGMRDFSVAK